MAIAAVSQSRLLSLARFLHHHHPFFRLFMLFMLFMLLILQLLMIISHRLLLFMFLRLLLPTLIFLTSAPIVPPLAPLARFLVYAPVRLRIE